MPQTTGFVSAPLGTVLAASVCDWLLTDRPEGSMGYHGLSLPPSPVLHPFSGRSAQEAEGRERSTGRGDPGPGRGPATCTYSHRRKARPGSAPRRRSSPGGGRTRGGRTGTGAGSCLCRSHSPGGTYGSVSPLGPRSSPRGTRSHTSWGRGGREDLSNSAKPGISTQLSISSPGTQPRSGQGRQGLASLPGTKAPGVKVKQLVPFVSLNSWEVPKCPRMTAWESFAFQVALGRQ